MLVAANQHQAENARQAINEERNNQRNNQTIIMAKNISA